VYPNPAHEFTQIQFTGTNEWVQIKLKNSEGKDLLTLCNSHYKAGIHELKLETSGLPSGIYIILIENGQKAYSQKLVVNH
jgi:hypothetical protein